MKHIARIIGEDNLQAAFEDLFHVMINIRGYTKEYEHRYGSVAKRYKKYWEAAADELLSKLEDGTYATGETTKYRGKKSFEKSEE